MINPSHKLNVLHFQYNIEKEKVSKLSTLTKTLKAPLKEIADHIPLHLHHGHKGGMLQKSSFDIRQTANCV